MKLGNELEQALLQRLRQEYQRGANDGLAVAEKIIGWLTRQPDTQRQREVREWAEKAVSEKRMTINPEGAKQ